MSEDWPEPVRRVADYLREARVEARLEEFGEGTPTAEAAARAAGAEPREIVKTLVFSCDGRAIVVMVPGDRRADTARIAAAADCGQVRSAGREAVEQATGFPPGGVAPFPLPRIETILVDKSVLANEVVWIGAGSERHMAALAPADLVRLSRARPADVAADAG